MPIAIRSGKWGTERLITLDIPARWTIHECGPLRSPQLSAAVIEQEIIAGYKRSAGPGASLAGKNITIVIDDLWRPTPAGPILEPLLRLLCAQQASLKDIAIILACGTHPAPSKEQIRLKVGTAIAETTHVYAHDCRNDLVCLGRTPTGTPLWVNRLVAEADLRVVIGGAYPHPSAGFSGGGKNLVPGICGIETITYLHDMLQGAGRRGGSTQTPLRREIAACAEMIGPYFLINTILNADGALASIFCGMPEETFRLAETSARGHYLVKPLPEADIVLIEAYPFDFSLNLLMDRTLWPLAHHRRTAHKVIFGECCDGIGGHELDCSLRTRITRRLKQLARGDFRGINCWLPNAVRAIRNIDTLQPFTLVSSSLDAAAVSKSHAHVTVLNDEKRLIEDWTRKNDGVTVALYRAAGLCFTES